MGLKIHEYPLESLTFGDDDFYDIDFWDGVGYQTKKIKGSTIKAGIALASLNIFNTDGTLTGDRTLSGDNFVLFFQELGQFIVHSHKNNVDNVIFEVRTQTGFESFTIRDHNTSDHLFCISDGVIEFNNSYRFPTTAGLPDQVLMIDALGNLQWVTLTDRNIYDIDGSLSANRFVDLANFVLHFSDLLGTTKFVGGNQFIIEANSGQPTLIQMNAGNGQDRILEFNTTGDARWRLQTTGNEIGGDTGTDIVLNAYDDAGVFIETVLRVERSNGKLFINEAYYLPKVDGISGQVLTTDGAGNASWQTPGAIAEKKIDSFYAFDMSQAAGYTWNGIANVGATALVTLNERTRLQTFAGTGAPDGCFVNAILPSYYVSGNQIRVDLVVTENGTGGNIKYQVGLNRPTAGNAFSGAATTQWLSSVHAATAGFNITKISLTFAGTDLSAGEPIAILIFRDPGDAADTFTGDSYINTISIEQI